MFGDAGKLEQKKGNEEAKSNFPCLVEMKLFLNSLRYVLVMMEN